MATKLKGSRLQYTGVNYGVYTSYTDKTATLAEISIDIGDTNFSGTGNSRRVREDGYNAYAGDVIAAYRAARQLAEVLKSEADKYLHYNNEVEGQLSLF